MSKKKANRSKKKDVKLPKKKNRVQGRACHSDKYFALRHANDMKWEEGLQIVQQFQSMADEPTFDFVMYVPDADDKIWVRVVNGNYIAKEFVSSGLKKNSKEQCYMDYICINGCNHTTFGRMKSKFVSASFAQATANKNSYIQQRQGLLVLPPRLQARHGRGPHPHRPQKKYQGAFQDGIRSSRPSSGLCLVPPEVFREMNERRVTCGPVQVLYCTVMYAAKIHSSANG